MSASSKRTSLPSGISAEDRNGKSLDHTTLKAKSASASMTRKNGSSCMANGSMPESDAAPVASMRERSSSIEQRKQAGSSSSKGSTSKSRAEALLSRKVTGSATSVRMPGTVNTRPPIAKGPRRSTSSDKVQIGIENGCMPGQTLDQSVSRTGTAPPKREVSSASSCSSSEGEEKGLKMTVSQKPPARRSGSTDENGRKVSGGGQPSQTAKSISVSKSKTPPSVRRKSSPPSTENNSRLQRQSSLRSSRNGTPQSSGRKSRTPSNSSLESGPSPTKLTESESRKLRNGTAKSSSEDSISDTERKSKGGLSRTPSTKRKVCMEIVLEKKVVSKSQGSTPGKTDSGISKSPSKQSLSSPSDDYASSTRTSPTKSKSATTLKPTLVGTQSGARRKIRSGSSVSDQKTNGACSVDKSRVVSAPASRTSKTDNSLPIISPYAPVRTKSGTAKSSDPKINLKSPDRSRLLSKVLIPQRSSRARARSMEPVGRSAPAAPVPVVDSATNPSPSMDSTATATTITVIHSRRSQSVERKSNKDSFVASRRQAWESKASQSPGETKKVLASPEKRFQRSGVGRRSLIDERKAMLFGGSVNTKSPIKEPQDLKKPAIPAKPDSIASKPPASRGDQRSQIELYISEELPSSPKPASHVVTPTADITKPAVLQENVQKIQPNAINLMPNKLPSSIDEVDSTRRYSPSKENEIISLPNDKIHVHSQKTSVMEGDALEKWSMLKENQTINELSKKQDGINLDNKEAESRRHALVEYSNRELETSYKQISEPDPSQDCPPEVKDGHYYQRIVNEEQARIESLCTLANKDMEKELSEEACGKLRASIGKASLLTNKKFKQFRGLCEQNINPTEGEALSVTNLDLTGFWDMVLIQVNDVNSMFAEIEELRQNGWRTPKQSPQKLKTVGKRPSSLTSPPPSPGIYKSTANPLTLVDPKVKAEREKKAAKARQARDEARKRLMAAKKAAARKRVKSEDGEPPVAVEIFVPDK